MKSENRFEALDLERDLATTAQDVAALRRSKLLQPLDLDAYLEFLAQLPVVSAVGPRVTTFPKAAAVFVLSD